MLLRAAELVVVVMRSVVPVRPVSVMTVWLHRNNNAFPIDGHRMAVNAQSRRTS